MKMIRAIASINTMALRLPCMQISYISIECFVHTIKQVTNPLDLNVSIIIQDSNAYPQSFRYNPRQGSISQSKFITIGVPKEN